MGDLYNALQDIERIIGEKGLDPVATKGQIGLKAGFFLVTIQPSTPDDPARIAALKSAAQQVLGQSLRV